MIYEPCVLLKPEMITVADTARVDAFCKIEGGNGVTIGEFCHVASFSHLNVGGGELVFGAHSGCSSHVVICSGQPDLQHAYISAADELANQHPLRMRTVIGKHVVIFANATVLPGITIGNYAVIGAGAVVTKDVPAGAIVMGVPGRIIGSRIMQDNGTFSVRYFPKLRDLAAARDIERVREYYGDAMPEQLAVDLVNFVTELE